MLETLHAELMERWRAHLAHPSPSVRVFVDDGPTSFSEYERSPIRVVFVLKEPMSPLDRALAANECRRRARFDLVDAGLLGLRSAGAKRTGMG